MTTSFCVCWTHTPYVALTVISCKDNATHITTDLVSHKRSTDHMSHHIYKPESQLREEKLFKTKLYNDGYVYKSNAWLHTLWVSEQTIFLMLRVWQTCFLSIWLGATPSLSHTCLQIVSMTVKLNCLKGRCLNDDQWIRLRYATDPSRGYNIVSPPLSY